jgi:hypothetical protein
MQTQNTKISATKKSEKHSLGWNFFEIGVFFSTKFKTNSAKKKSSNKEYIAYKNN